MTRYDILLHLSRLDALSPAAKAALNLARRLDAWLGALHVVPMGPAAFASPEGVAVQVAESDSLLRDAEARAGWWRAALAEAGVAGDWQVTAGDAVGALCHAARWSDLVVIDRPQPDVDAPTGWGTVSRTVFGAATPVLILPAATTVVDPGRRVLVAWNRSREATLAIRGALPLLERAEAVDVLAGEPGEDPFKLRYLPTLDLEAWLGRRGINPRTQAFDATRDVGARILDAAHAGNADLIVMGAWGRSRISEFVLGGTTRYLFQHSDLPLLVAH